MPVKILTAVSQRRSAQVFDLCSAVAVLSGVLIPIWFGASIFVYAFIRHHPNSRVADYLRPSGYRFYGYTGALVVLLNFSPQFAHWVGGLWQVVIACWLVGIVTVVIPALVSIVRAYRDNWNELQVEVDHA